MEDTRSGAERLDFYSKMDAHLTEEIQKADKELHTLLKAQHEVRRNIFHAQFDARQGK